MRKNRKKSAVLFLGCAMILAASGCGKVSNKCSSVSGKQEMSEDIISSDIASDDDSFDVEGAIFIEDGDDYTAKPFIGYEDGEAAIKELLESNGDNAVSYTVDGVDAEDNSDILKVYESIMKGN